MSSNPVYHFLYAFIISCIVFRHRSSAAFNRRDNDITSNVIKNDQCGCSGFAQPGPPGIPGVPGLPGSRAQDGNKGEKGDTGVRGDIGPQGPIGPVGPPGLPGERGKRGIDGERGGLGEPGERGDKGERGYTGFIGIKGSKGDTASPGHRVAFSVARSQKLGPVLQDTPVIYDVIFSNIGDGFEVYSSHFICRHNGTYLFMAHVLSQNTKDVFAWIMMNDRHKVPLHGDGRSGYGFGSQTIILSLKQDDHIWIQLSKDSALMNDYSTFSGYLLFEN